MKRILALISLVAAFSLCTQPQLGKPEVKEVVSCWGNVTPSTTEILTEISVYNPNPIPLPLKDVLTEIYMSGIKMGEGGL